MLSGPQARNVAAAATSTPGRRAGRLCSGEGREGGLDPELADHGVLDALLVDVVVRVPVDQFTDVGRIDGEPCAQTEGQPARFAGADTVGVVAGDVQVTTYTDPIMYDGKPKAPASCALNAIAANAVISQAAAR